MVVKYVWCLPCVITSPPPRSGARGPLESWNANDGETPRGFDFCGCQPGGRIRLDDDVSEAGEGDGSCVVVVLGVTMHQVKSPGHASTSDFVWLRSKAAWATRAPSVFCCFQAPPLPPGPNDFNITSNPSNHVDFILRFDNNLFMWLHVIHHRYFQKLMMNAPFCPSFASNNWISVRKSKLITFLKVIIIVMYWYDGQKVGSQVGFWFERDSWNEKLLSNKLKSVSMSDGPKIQQFL